MTEQIDLIPEEYYLRQIRLQRLGRWLMLAMVLVGAILLVGFLIRLRVVSLRADLGPLRESVVTTQQYEGRIAPLTSELEAAFGRHLVVDELLQEPSWCGLFSDIAAATAGRLSLTRFTMSKSTATVAEMSESPQSVAAIAITGIAPSHFEIIRFVGELSGSEHLAYIEPEISRIPRPADDRVNVEFEIRGIAKTHQGPVYPVLMGTPALGTPRGQESSPPMGGIMSAVSEAQEIINRNRGIANEIRSENTNAGNRRNRSTTGYR